MEVHVVLAELGQDELLEECGQHPGAIGRAEQVVDLGRLELEVLAVVVEEAVTAAAAAKQDNVGKDSCFAK